LAGEKINNTRSTADGEVRGPVGVVAEQREREVVVPRCEVGNRAEQVGRAQLCLIGTLLTELREVLSGQIACAEGERPA
jgi:hypothetical protein